MQKNDLKPMVSVEVNEEEVRRMYVKKLDEQIKKIDKDLIFWDTKELTKRTCMSLRNEEMAQYRLMNHDLYPDTVDNR